MNTRAQDHAQTIRMIFEMSRADNPRLFDELALFPKGAKRVNRLRTLAYDGLLAQHGALGYAPASGGVDQRQPRDAGSAEGADVTNTVFAPGLAE